MMAACSGGRHKAGDCFVLRSSVADVHMRISEVRGRSYVSDVVSLPREGKPLRRLMSQPFFVLDGLTVAPDCDDFGDAARRAGPPTP